MGEQIGFVGLDVHKATIAVCVAGADRGGEVRFVGEMPTSWRHWTAGVPARPGQPHSALRLRGRGLPAPPAIVALTVWWSRRA